MVLWGVSLRQKASGSVLETRLSVHIQFTICYVPYTIYSIPFFYTTCAALCLQTVRYTIYYSLRRCSYLGLQRILQHCAAGSLNSAKPSYARRLALGVALAGRAIRCSSRQAAAVAMTSSVSSPISGPCPWTACCQ